MHAASRCLKVAILLRRRILACKSHAAFSDRTALTFRGLRSVAVCFDADRDRRTP